MKSIRILVSILLFSCFIDILAQESPYSIFGDRTPTLGIHITNEGYTLNDFECIVFFKDGSVGVIEFDFKAKIAKLKDSKGNELQQTNITPSDIARFTTPDPKAELYPTISPYAYCTGNPIRFIDPTGMFIEERSTKDWKRMRADITKERDRLVSQIENIQTKATMKGWDEKMLQRKLGNRIERVGSLNGSLATMDVLEGSTQGYMLKKLGPNIAGSVSYNSSSGLIGINYYGVANFIHEMTHAGQFETGAIGFMIETGNTILQDVYDEVAAYQAQYAYSPNSVATLVPGQPINSVMDITPSWLYGISANGEYIYAPGSSHNMGINPIGIYSTPAQLMQAYPGKFFPSDFSIIPNPTYHIKR